MPETNKLDKKYKTIALSSSYEDCIELLQIIIDEIADIRQSFGEQDSIKFRKEIIDYLMNSIDIIRRLRKNTSVNVNQSSDDDI